MEIQGSGGRLFPEEEAERVKRMMKLIPNDFAVCYEDLKEIFSKEDGI